MHDLFIEWTGLPPEMVGDMHDWAMHPYRNAAGEVEAIAAVSGSEIHFAAAPSARHRVMQRDRIRAFLSPIFNRYGFLTTRVLHGNVEGMSFVKRLGFELTGVNLSWDHFMLCALPFPRAKEF